MKAIRYLTPAKLELVESAQHYADVSPKLARAFMDEVERVVVQIANQPDIAPIFADGVHRKILNKFPYSLLYIAQPDCVLIVAVMHHKREPGYWEERLR